MHDPIRPVTTYRIGWAQPAYMARRTLWLLITGAAPAMGRRMILRFARADGPTYVRRAAREVWLNGLIPPWQAEVQESGCTCNARRGWTEQQAVARVVAEHNEKARRLRCGNSTLRLRHLAGALVGVHDTGFPPATSLGGRP